MNELHKYVPMNEHNDVSHVTVGGQVCDEEIVHTKYFLGETWNELDVQLSNSEDAKD